MRSLWDFSLAVYAKDGVADACLALQREYALDVNLLLYCCWAGEIGVDLDTADTDAAVELCARWSAEIVQRLRAARTWMKSGDSIEARMPMPAYAQLRDDIKSLELEAERLQQAALASLHAERVPVSRDTATRLAKMANNLKRYLTTAAVHGGDAIDDKLAVLLAGASGANASAALDSLERSAHGAIADD